MRDGIPPRGARCPVTSPDLFTIRCQLAEGHDGLHRNNSVVWHHPLLVTVGGQSQDLTVDTDHWQNGQVRLSSQVVA